MQHIKIQLTDEQFVALVGLALNDMGIPIRLIMGMESKMLISRRFASDPNDIRPTVREIADMIADQ